MYPSGRGADGGVAVPVWRQKARGKSLYLPLNIAVN